MLKKLVVFMVALVGMSSAMAQETYFNFDYTSPYSPLYSGNLVLGGTEVGPDAFLINSISGTMDMGQTPTLLSTSTPYMVGGAPVFDGSNPVYASPVTYPGSTPGEVFAFDNILYTSPSGLPLDQYGIGLATGVGGDDSGNLYALPGLLYLDDGILFSSAGQSIGVPINLTVTEIAPAVPEASTYVMFLAGLAALIFVARRKSGSMSMPGSMA